MNPSQLYAIVALMAAHIQALPIPVLEKDCVDSSGAGFNNFDVDQSGSSATESLRIKYITSVVIQDTTETVPATTVSQTANEQTTEQQQTVNHDNTTSDQASDSAQATTSAEATTSAQATDSTQATTSDQSTDSAQATSTEASSTSTDESNGTYTAPTFAYATTKATAKRDFIPPTSTFTSALITATGVAQTTVAASNLVQASYFDKREPEALIFTEGSPFFISVPSDVASNLDKREPEALVVSEGSPFFISVPSDVATLPVEDGESSSASDLVSGPSGTYYKDTLAVEPTSSEADYYTLTLSDLDSIPASQITNYILDSRQATITTNAADEGYTQVAVSDLDFIPASEVTNYILDSKNKATTTTSAPDDGYTQVAVSDLGYYSGNTSGLDEILGNIKQASTLASSFTIPTTTLSDSLTTVTEPAATPISQIHFHSIKTVGLGTTVGRIGVATLARHSDGAKIATKTTAIGFPTVTA
ncbi:unnamed protein product [Ambrosiozyma monospora]|uniref:Unnamed protein product n=1 Tax=Ambrosiozyma monospora TaxID=43982 RepID=A0ACB5T1Q0_AMBMO|nr:unnamed protein product [Ambrosiozyma monospora]